MKLVMGQGRAFSFSAQLISSRDITSTNHGSSMTARTESETGKLVSQRARANALTGRWDMRGRGASTVVAVVRSKGKHKPGGLSN